MCVPPGKADAFEGFPHLQGIALCLRNWTNTINTHTQCWFPIGIVKRSSDLCFMTFCVYAVPHYVYAIMHNGNIKYTYSRSVIVANCLLMFSLNIGYKALRLFFQNKFSLYSSHNLVTQFFPHASIVAVININKQYTIRFFFLCWTYAMPAPLPQSNSLSVYYIDMHVCLCECWLQCCANL